MDRQFSECDPEVRINKIQGTNDLQEAYTEKLGNSIEHIPTSVMNVLHGYAWPGNIRELQNVIERAVINSSGPKLRLVDELKPPQDLPTPLKTMEAVEYDHIVQVLEHTGWKVSCWAKSVTILQSEVRLVLCVAIQQR